MSNATTKHDTLKTHIGLPVDRVDGVLKVTGRAVYAYEQTADDPVVFGYILGAGIARGRIRAIDTTRASAAPGVLHVMTYRNAPAQPAFGPPVMPKVPEVFTRPRPVLSTDRIRYYDEPVALVLAETFEAARGAAGLVKVEYESEAGAYDLSTHLADAYRPERTNAGFQTDSKIGDFDAAFAAGEVKLDTVYTTPYEHHNPMEPHATLAVWSGDEVTIYTGAQTLANFRAGIAATLQIPPEKIRIVSPFVGGRIWFETDRPPGYDSCGPCSERIKETGQNRAHKAADVCQRRSPGKNDSFRSAERQRRRPVERNLA